MRIGPREPELPVAPRVANGKGWMPVRPGEQTEEAQHKRDSAGGEGPLWEPDA